MSYRQNLEGERWGVGGAGPLRAFAEVVGVN